MIKSKKCKLCDKPAFSKGLCSTHSNKNSLKKSGRIKNSRQKTFDRKKEQSDIRNEYFDYHIEKCFKSEESNLLINQPNRSNICHLIDKGRHPSLQDNLINCIYLTFSEHERFDKLLFSLEFEKIEKEFKNSWQKTCEKYLILLPLCKESTNFTRELKKYLDERFKSE